MKQRLNKLIVFDIDDTLLKACANGVFIYKKKNGVEIPLTTSKFAADTDKDNPEVTYCYRDYRDAEKVRNSIANGRVLEHNVRILEKYVDAGWRFCFLTARGMERIVMESLCELFAGRPFMKALSRSDCAAVNDDDKFYEGSCDEEKKAYALLRLCSRYDEVVFVDDDQRNLDAAKRLGCKNLRVIQAK